MKENLSKKDIYWNYFSKLFSLVSGLITLPLILMWLSEEEIAVNYLFINIISYTAIFDLGFSPQLSRNMGFIFGGASDIKSVGFEKSNSNEINYRLVKNVISSAKFLYARISLFVLLLLLTVGTWYVKTTTNGYQVENEIIWMWLVFCAIETLDFYFRFYTPLLQGKGDIAELNKIDFISSIAKVITTILFLWLGLRLWAVIIGMFVRIVITRIMSVRVLYFKDSLKDKLNGIIIDVNEKREMIRRLWHNARRSAIVQIASFCTTQMGFLLTGIFLTARDISSYGLLMQLTLIITGISTSLSSSVTPIYAQLRTNNDMAGVKRNFYFTTGLFYILYIMGSLFMVTLCPICLTLIKANAVLPSLLVTIIYIVYKFLEGQHCICIYCISSKNKVYDTESATIMAVATIILLFVSLKYTSYGLFGVVVVQFVVAIVYANWKWPYELCKDFGDNYFRVVYNSFKTVAVTSVDNLKKHILK